MVAGDANSALDSMKARTLLRYFLLILALLLLLPGSRRVRPAGVLSETDTLVCVIDIPSGTSNRITYPVGFQYEMLSLFAARNHCHAEIRLSRPGENWTDSLAHGRIDLLARPGSDTLAAQFFESVPMEDRSAWLASRKQKTLRRASGFFLAHFMQTEEYQNVITRFSIASDPISRAETGKTYSQATPYDEILKETATQIGWDWRILAAIIWQESHFHIEARSPRGALGLMQVMPRTASLYEIENLTDPRQNIEAGLQHLIRLQEMFRNYASGHELAKFTLAAYNAGEGRVFDCIRYAKANGMPYATWDDLKEVIPHLRDPEKAAVDSVVKNGVFQGDETIAYIDQTIALFGAYCAIAPGRLLQGLPLRHTGMESEAESLSADRLPDSLPEASGDPDGPEHKTENSVPDSGGSGGSSPESDKKPAPGHSR